MSQLAAVPARTNILNWLTLGLVLTSAWGFFVWHPLTAVLWSVLLGLLPGTTRRAMREDPHFAPGVAILVPAVLAILWLLAATLNALMLSAVPLIMLGGGLLLGFVLSFVKRLPARQLVRICTVTLVVIFGWLVVFSLPIHSPMDETPVAVRVMYGKGGWQDLSKDQIDTMTGALRNLRHGPFVLAAERMHSSNARFEMTFADGKVRTAWFGSHFSWYHHHTTYILHEADSGDGLMDKLLCFDDFQAPLDATPTTRP